MSDIVRDIWHLVILNLEGVEFARFFFSFQHDMPGVFPYRVFDRIGELRYVCFHLSTARLLQMSDTGKVLVIHPGLPLTTFLIVTHVLPTLIFIHRLSVIECWPGSL